MIFALREPTTVRALDGLPAVAERPRGRRRARASITPVPGRLDDRVRDRIMGETRGNLALLELSRGSADRNGRGAFGDPWRASSPVRLEERYLRRVARFRSRSGD